MPKTPVCLSFSSLGSTASASTASVRAFMVSDAFACGHEGCEYKRQHLERQIDYARAHNNTHRVAGLQEALSRVDEYCTDSWLLKLKENKVAEKQRKVVKRQRELE
ncbi:DUF1090 domain-containing protein [Salmonella enterica]|nr:DUF1090 domain-containing protein [Salmonella enterica]